MIDLRIKEAPNGGFRWRVSNGYHAWGGLAESLDDARFAVALWGAVALSEMQRKG